MEFGDKRRTLDQSEPTAGVIANGAARKVPDGSRCVFGPWYPTRRGPLIGAYEVGMLDLCDHRRVLDPIQVHAATARFLDHSRQSRFLVGTFAKMPVHRNSSASRTNQTPHPFENLDE